MSKPKAFSLSADITGDLPVGHHVGEQPGVDRIADAPELVLALRRLDEHDVGAGLGERLAAADRLVEAQRRCAHRCAR